MRLSYRSDTIIRATFWSVQFWEKAGLNHVSKDKECRQLELKIAKTSVMLTPLTNLKSNLPV